MNRKILATIICIASLVGCVSTPATKEINYGRLVLVNRGSLGGSSDGVNSEVVLVSMAGSPDSLGIRVFNDKGSLRTGFLISKENLKYNIATIEKFIEWVKLAYENGDSFTKEIDRVRGNISPQGIPFNNSYTFMGYYRPTAVPELGYRLNYNATLNIAACPTKSCAEPVGLRLKQVEYWLDLLKSWEQGDAAFNAKIKELQEINVPSIRVERDYK